MLMLSKTEKFMTAGSGILMQGVFWLVFWLGPAFRLFEADPRWSHNFAMSIIFITIGLAYHFRKISCQVLAVFASFLTIPTFLAFWPGVEATFAASIMLGITILLFLIDSQRGVELVNPNPRLKAWLKIHLLNFAYLGLAHMPFIFFLVRWYNPQPFLNYLPVENRIADLPTAAYNLMLLLFVPLAIMERYVKKIWVIEVSKLGFLWSVLMITVPLFIIVL